MLKTTYTKIGIGRLCMLFGKTRHAFYDKSWHEQQQEQAHYIVLEMVSEIRREIPGIGTPKLHHMIKQSLKTQGIKMGRDSLHNLLLAYRLTIKRRRRYVKTTDSKHWMKKYPNLIKQFQVLESECLWVADITYIAVNDDFNFLNLITDVYSKRIMGYCLHPTLEAEGTLSALKMALNNRRKTNNKLIHHSDRGTQYCCADYVAILQSSHIAISMTENGDPYENPVAERVNGILKGDFNLSRQFESREQAINTIEKSIKAYNELRPHMSCNYLTPQEAHQLTGPLKRKWKAKQYFKAKQKNETIIKT